MWILKRKKLSPKLKKNRPNRKRIAREVGFFNYSIRANFVEHFFNLRLQITTSLQIITIDRKIRIIRKEVSLQKASYFWNNNKFQSTLVRSSKKYLIFYTRKKFFESCANANCKCPFRTPPKSNLSLRPWRSAGNATAPPLSMRARERTTFWSRTFHP